MSRRSVVVNLSNDTNFVLALDAYGTGLDWGEWQTQPPVIVEDNTTGTWENDSDGAGVQGHARYYIIDEYIDDTSSRNWVYLSWDDPLLGSNSCDCSVSNGSLYNCQKPSDISGDNATMSFTLQRVG